jgi:hypothetical protein
MVEFENQWEFCSSKKDLLGHLAALVSKCLMSMRQSLLALLIPTYTMQQVADEWIWNVSDLLHLLF